MAIKKVNQGGVGKVASIIMTLSLTSLLIFMGTFYFSEEIISILYADQYCGKMGCGFGLLIKLLLGVAASVVTLYCSSVGYLVFRRHPANVVISGIAMLVSILGTGFLAMGAIGYIFSLFF